MLSTPSSARKHRFRALLAEMAAGTGLPMPADWSARSLARWVVQDTTGRAGALAPLFLAVSDLNTPALPPPLRDAALRLLALARWVPEDPVWGSAGVVQTLDGLVECFGGRKRLAWLGKQVGVSPEQAWFPPDGQSSAKALVLYARTDC